MFYLKEIKIKEHSNVYIFQECKALIGVNFRASVVLRTFNLIHVNKIVILSQFL